MKDYICNTPLAGIEDKPLPVNARVSLKDEDAQPLLELGAIRLADENSDSASAPTASTVTTQADDAERMAAIKDAIGKIDPTDKASHTTDGRPTTAAIVAITGWDVSAKERDAAWAELSAPAA